MGFFDTPCKCRQCGKGFMKSGWEMMQQTPPICPDCRRENQATQREGYLKEKGRLQARAQAKSHKQKVKEFNSWRKNFSQNTGFKI